jgi:sulfide:quinone oxidoreductase
MDIRQISDEFAVSPQIAIADIPALAGHGFVALICNRPAGEEPGQPAIDETREAAQAAGLAFHHIPVSGGAFPDAAIAAFRAVRKGSEGPVLAYCRSGTRSITLETLANPEGVDAEERLGRAAGAGYDLSGLRGSLG